MRTELYSVRSSKEEISYINQNLKKIATKLNRKAAVKVLFKTEIDWNPKKIKADLMDSLVAHNPPELHIFVNAIDTKNNSSFCSLFTPFLTALEKDILKEAPPEYKKSGLYPHIQVHTLEGLPSDYPAYCFSFRRRKVLVLPEIGLMDTDPCDYICEAVIAAKDFFFKQYDQCPEGFTYADCKPTSKKSRFTSLFSHSKSVKEEEEAEYEAEIPTEAPKEADETETNYEAPSISIMDMDAKPAMDIIIFDEEEKEEEPEPVVNIIEEEELPSTTEETKPEEPSSDADSPQKKSGFRAFVRSFIPMKGDTAGSIIRKIVVLIAIIAFITGAGLLIKFYIIDPGVNEADMEEIQSIFYSTPVQTVTDPEGNVIATVDEVSRNWDGLKKINKEIVGWIKLDKTKIDYPVLFHKEDNEKSQFYLYKNYKKKYSDFGSIFMDYRCKKGINSKHVILHGHNMGSDDSMFGSLLNYSRAEGRTQGNTKFYKTSPIITLDTPKDNTDWIIFAVMKIDVANNKNNIFNYLQTDFEGSAQYMNFIYNIKVRSYLDVNVPINEKDRLLTLSTCSYETDNMRTIVVARQVRDGEDVSKYIKSVKRYSPQGVVYTDFASEYAQGNLKWYDGKGKLNGNGDLEFMDQREMFKVTFVDAKGKKILSQYVLKGEDATTPVGAPPVKKSDSKYNYSFRKWSPSFKNVTQDLTIKPVYDKYLKPTQSSQTPPPPVEEPVTQAPQTQPPTQVTTTTPAPVTEATTSAPLQTNPPIQETTLSPDPVESFLSE